MKNEQIEELLEILIESIKSTESFALEHAPSIAKEIVFLGRINFAISIVLILASFALTYVWIRVCKTSCTSVYSSFEDSLKFILGTSIPILFAISVSKFFLNMEAVVTPKLYLLKELADML